MDASRRESLKLLAGLALASRRVEATEPPPETRRLRLARFPFELVCLAPMWIAEELLRAEGFDDLQYVAPTANGQYPAVARGELDLGITDIFGFLPQLDAGSPTLALGGIHAGCYELIATHGVRSVRELKGKTVVVANAGRQAFVSVMLAQVGLDGHLRGRAGAQRTQAGSRGVSRATSLSRSNRCARFPTGAGASSTRPTACASTRCACTRWAPSSRARPSCSRKARIGASSSS